MVLKKPHSIYQNGNKDSSPPPFLKVEWDFQKSGQEGGLIFENVKMRETKSGGERNKNFRDGSLLYLMLAITGALASTGATDLMHV